MMVIYMRHPVHGTKVAISEAEAAADRLNGWKDYDAGALMTPAEPQPVYSDDIALMRKQWSKKFGKTPHHKKTAETLWKEITNDNGTGNH